MSLAFENTSRDEWKFIYKAERILPWAKARLAAYTQGEAASLAEHFKLTHDKSIPIGDRQIEQARAVAAAKAVICEQLRVWVYEFRRDPAREYQLSLGDVVFFGLHTAITDPEDTRG